MSDDTKNGNDLGVQVGKSLTAPRRSRDETLYREFAILYQDLKEKMLSLGEIKTEIVRILDISDTTYYTYLREAKQRMYIADTYIPTSTADIVIPSEQTESNDDHKVINFPLNERDNTIVPQTAIDMGSSKLTELTEQVVNNPNSIAVNIPPLEPPTNKNKESVFIKLLRKMKIMK